MSRRGPDTAPHWPPGAARGQPGVDFAAAMVEEARRNFPEADFHEGDAEALPFEDGSFDAVTCSFGMLHFARPEQAVAEAFRALRPGGRYAFSAWCAADRVAHFGMFRRAVAAHGAPRAGGIPAGPEMFRFADPGECARVLEAAGFRETRVEEIAIRRRVSPEALVEGLRHATVRSRALLDAQTPVARAAIEAAVLEEARAMAGPDGILDLSLPAVLASGARPRQTTLNATRPTAIHAQSKPSAPRSRVRSVPTEPHSGPNPNSRCMTPTRHPRESGGPSMAGDAAAAGAK